MTEAALCLMDGEPVPFDAERFVASDEPKAIEQAKSWAASFDFIADDVLLLLKAGTKGICALRRNEF